MQSGLDSVHKQRDRWTDGQGETNHWLLIAHEQIGKFHDLLHGLQVSEDVILLLIICALFNFCQVMIKHGWIRGKYFSPAKCWANIMNIRGDHLQPANLNGTWARESEYFDWLRLSDPYMQPYTITLIQEMSDSKPLHDNAIVNWTLRNRFQWNSNLPLRAYENLFTWMISKILHFF